MSIVARGRLAGLLRDRIGSAVAALASPARAGHLQRRIPNAWAPCVSSTQLCFDDPMSGGVSWSSLLTRGYFAGRAQIKNADGQDFAQMRAGVKLHKAIMAAIAHPSMAHRFDGTGVTILEVRMARDFKLAHVRWTVRRDGDPRAAAKALRRNATALKTMAGKMLHSKHTPRLEFIDDDARTVREAELDEAFELAAEQELETERHLANLAMREMHVSRMKAEGTYRPGIYEHLLDETYDDELHDDDVEDVEMFDDEEMQVEGLSEWVADGGERDEEFETLMEELMDDVDDEDDWSEDDEDDDDEPGADEWVKPRGPSA